jgi:Zn-dependent alcohol dehydrogenase
VGGAVHHYRRRPGRRGNRNALIPTGPRLEGHGIRRGASRTDVPKIVDWYMEGKIEIDPMITHTMQLPDINKG